MHTPIRLDALAEEKETTAVKQRSKKGYYTRQEVYIDIKKTKQERN
jgi:hypothetical protein